MAERNRTNARAAYQSDPQIIPRNGPEAGTLSQQAAYRGAAVRSTSSLSVSTGIISLLAVLLSDMLMNPVSNHIHLLLLPEGKSVIDYGASPVLTPAYDSSLQHSDQAFPPGYIGQERGPEASLYTRRELSRSAVRPLVTYDHPMDRQTHQSRYPDPYHSPPLDNFQGSMRPLASGYTETFPEAPLHRRPSSLQDYDPPQPRARVSPTRSLWGTEYLQDYSDGFSEPSIPPSTRNDTQGVESYKSQHPTQHMSSQQKPHHTQKRANRDEFDGPSQYLPRPTSSTFTATESELPSVPVTLNVREQDTVLGEVNARLSQCAFNFIAKYNFPIPLEAGKRRVESPSDREWTEWAHLLKRLATKRRIPARLLYEGQIKQMVTVLENSLEMRHASAHLSRPPKDDWNVLQLVSAGVQVAKLLKDGETMRVLETLYRETEAVMIERKGKRVSR